MMYQVLWFFIGLCIGSFLNVCIYRLPKDRSIVSPPSHCPQCKKPIVWYDNIPLISFLILRAKCRHCQMRIPFRYFVVELLTGLLFVFFYSQFGLTLVFFKCVFFFSLLVLVSFVDIDHHAIPAYFCFLGIIAGLAFSAYESVPFVRAFLRSDAPPSIQQIPLYRTFVGLLFGLGFTYFFKFAGDMFLTMYLSLRKKESIEGEKESLGLGDVDFMGMVGVFFGIKFALITFFVAPFIALIYTVFALLFKKSHLIPYLPYLSLAALVTFLWGDKILRLVLG